MSRKMGAVISQHGPASCPAFSVVHAERRSCSCSTHTESAEISQRINLVSRTSFDSGSIPVLPNTTPGRAVGLAHETPMDELNEDMMDIAFVDEPIQCEPETCAKVKNGYKFADRMTWDETNQFKYLLDIGTP